jgi:hypothetical protein
VRGREDGNVGTEHASVADGNKTAVQDSEVEIGVKACADGDVAAVIDVWRRREFNGLR